MELEEFDQVETEIVTEEQTYTTEGDMPSGAEFQAGAHEEAVVATEEEVQTEVVDEEQQPKVYHFAWQVRVNTMFTSESVWHGFQCYSSLVYTLIYPITSPFRMITISSVNLYLTLGGSIKIV